MNTIQTVAPQAASQTTPAQNVSGTGATDATQAAGFDRVTQQLANQAAQSIFGIIFSLLLNELGQG